MRFPSLHPATPSRPEQSRKGHGSRAPRRCPLGRAGTALLAAAALLAHPAGAQERTSPDEGRLHGTLVDANTGSAVVTAQVRLRELGRTDVSHADGSFHFEGLRPGNYTLVIERIGYALLQEEVEIRAGDLTRVDLVLRPSVLSVAGVVVTGVGRERSVNETYRPTSVLSGEELGRALSTSIAATIRGEPGIAMQSFGPGPSQPVVRGMGGDRVLVLEDGQRTGDLASTAADHAVGIDPIAAERIEVLRGPAGVLYGSNALGGVINVIRGEVPRTVPESFGGTATLQGESVNNGVTASGILRFPIGGSLSVRAELTGRQAGDIRTPLGPLESTQLQGCNGALGASFVGGWGYAGLAYRDYTLDHGLPGEFQGVRIPGSHEGGVESETRRRVVRAEAAHLAGIGPFSSVEFEGNFVHYLHDEVEERRQTDQGVIRILGTQFDQIFGSGTLVARHEHQAGDLRSEGAIGAFASGRDLIAGGTFPGSRSATEAGLAFYAYEELGWNPFRLQLGLRYDWSRVEPVDLSPIRLGGDEPVPVRAREFGDFSGSASLLMELRPGWMVGGGFSRAFRTPSIRELYSDGPHLADYSYDVGNPELNSEIGWGADLFLRVSRSGVEAEGTLFRNRVENFIYYAPTGEPDPRFRRFPVFRARSDDALFEGADGRMQVEVLPHLVLDATGSYVRARRLDTDEPLPAIPPFQGEIGARYDVERYFLTLGWEGAARQDRVSPPIPSPIEEGAFIVPERPTPGYGLLNLGAGVRWVVGETVHSVILRADNVTDRVRYDHLSRSKDVAPEPGRNVQLLYRVQF